MGRRYSIEFARAALDQMVDFSTRVQNMIIDGIAKKLSFEPASETRNQKPLRPNQLAPWELRIGKYRVFYDIDMDNHRVFVLAVGIKERNVLYIGGKEIGFEDN